MPHRRFSFPGLDAIDLLQIGSFSSASEACCGCGALQMDKAGLAGGASAVVDYGRSGLLDLDTHTNPLAACGWGACSRGSAGSAVLDTSPADICSIWGNGPAPASGRCVSRCPAWPACCALPSGCACDAAPRARELRDFQALDAWRSELAELRFYGREHGHLDGGPLEELPCSTTSDGDGSGRVMLLPSPSPSPSASASPSPSPSLPMWDMLSSHSPAAVHAHEGDGRRLLLSPRAHDAREAIFGRALHAQRARDLLERAVEQSDGGGGGDDDDVAPPRPWLAAERVGTMGLSARGLIGGGDDDDDAPLVTEVYPPLHEQEPPPPNATACTYLRVCAMVLNLGGREPRLSALQSVVRAERLPISLRKNRTLHYWELHFEERTREVGHAYAAVYKKSGFEATLERGDVDLARAAEMYALEEGDVSTILRTPLQRHSDGRFVWESRVADLSFAARLIAVGGAQKVKPKQANMRAKKVWAAPMWAAQVAKAAKETFDDPADMPPPPPPDPWRTPPPEPPPVPSPSPPMVPPPLEMDAELHRGLVAHDHMVQMIEALNGSFPNSPSLVVVFAGPLELPLTMPPRWRPRTKVVLVDKTRVELMGDICALVRRDRRTLDRLAGTDSAAHAGVLPSGGAAQSTAAATPRRRTSWAKPDARRGLPEIIRGPGVRHGDGEDGSNRAAAPMASPAPTVGGGGGADGEGAWWLGSGRARRRQQAGRDDSTTHVRWTPLGPKPTPTPVQQAPPPHELSWADILEPKVVVRPPVISHAAKAKAAQLALFSGGRRGSSQAR